MRKADMSKQWLKRVVTIAGKTAHFEQRIAITEEYYEIYSYKETGLPSVPLALKKDGAVANML